MYPEINFFNLFSIDSYSLMLFIGVITSLILVKILLKSKKMSQDYIDTIQIVGVIVVLIGIGFAVVFQKFYDLFSKNSSHGEFPMTFYGGLIGGIGSFILIHKFYIAKKYPGIGLEYMYEVSPCCITGAHFFGRIGCFLAGCCYGKETTSFLAIKLYGAYRYPTQLFEATFLLIITVIMFLLIYKKNNKNSMTIYLISYGIFRFLIEFIRGDDRGGIANSLSPSQWVSLIAIITGILLLYIRKKKVKVN